MANFTSPCLANLEAHQTAASFMDVFICPFRQALTIPGLPSVTGDSLFYFIISAGILSAVYLRTGSFAFTAVVMIVCGTAVIAIFPAMVIQVALGMAALALAGIMVKIFTEKR